MHNKPTLLTHGDKKGMLHKYSISTEKRSSIVTEIFRKKQDSFLLEIHVFRDVAPCWTAQCYRRFGEAWYLYLSHQTEQLPFDMAWCLKALESSPAPLSELRCSILFTTPRPFYLACESKEVRQVLIPFKMCANILFAPELKYKGEKKFNYHLPLSIKFPFERRAFQDNFLRL